jgi:hypothetical protein
MLSYRNGERKQKIYLRQGEDADYLMANGDPFPGYGNYRGLCAMFTTCNLTADRLEAYVNAGNPSRFTDYPTQAGAFFQWSNNYQGTGFGGGQRWAWSPHTNAQQPWPASPYTSGTYLSTLGSDNETCPDGYRRPNDGSISGNEGGSSNNSEMRQSLFTKFLTGYNNISETGNTLRGYYADGYFDRRYISNMSVAYNTKDVAYVGRIFFNPTVGSDRFNASLFFPGAGSLLDANGWLGRNGSQGQYWTSTIVTSNSSYASMLQVREDNHAALWTAHVANGNSIRCVKIVTP